MARSRATDITALVRAAAEVFESKGYRNATIDDIAEAAGVSRPTVYKYTKSKRDLLDRMVDVVLGDLTAQLREALDSNDSPAERFRRVIDVHVRGATSLSSFYSILFSEEVELSDDARVKFRRFSHDVAVDFRAMLEDFLGQSGSPAGMDTWIASNLILSMLTSLYRWYNPEGPTDPMALGEQIMLLLGAVVPSSEVAPGRRKAPRPTNKADTRKSRAARS